MGLLDSFVVSLEVTLCGLLSALPLVLFTVFVKYAMGGFYEGYFFLSGQNTSAVAPVELALSGLVAGVILSCMAALWCAVLGASVAGRLLFWVPLAIWISWSVYYLIYLIDSQIGFWLQANLVGGYNVPLFLSYPLFVFFITKPVERLAGSPGLAKKSTIAQAIILITAIVYYFFLPRFFFYKKMTDFGRSLIRVLLHPVFFEFTLFMVRSWARAASVSWPKDFEAKRRTGFLVVPIMIVASLYGRFLITAAGNTANMAVVSTLVAFLEVFLRLSAGRRDRLIARMIKGKAYADEMFKKRSGDSFRTDLILFDLVAEQCSILSMSVTVFLFQITSVAGGMSIERWITSLVVQVGIEFITTVLVILVERHFAKIDVVKGWRDRRPKAWAYLAYLSSSSFVMGIFVLYSITHTKSGILAYRDKQ